MRCPKTLTPLRSSSRHAHVHQCHNCAGMLVERSAFPHNLRLIDECLTDHPQSDYLCPACRKPMNRFSYRGCEIDACPQCQSIWLDAGEQKVLINKRMSAEEKSLIDTSDIESLLEDHPDLGPEGYDALDAMLDAVLNAISSL